MGDNDKVLKKLQQKQQEDSFVRTVKKEISNQIQSAQTPVYRPAKIVSINSDGTLNITIAGDDTPIPNIPNRTLTDVSVGDMVLIVEPIGNLANAYAAVNWGSQPARIGYKDCYITFDQGLICTATNGTKVYINRDDGFKVINVNGNVTAQLDTDGNLIANKLNNTGAAVYGTVGNVTINGGGGSGFSLKRKSDDSTGYGVFIEPDVSNGKGFYLWNDYASVFGATKSGTNIWWDNETNPQNSAMISCNNDYVMISYNNSGNTFYIYIDNNGFHITNGSYIHTFGVNASGNFTIDGNDTWSGTITENNLNKTYVCGILTKVETVT